jgi:uncharacterized protein (DUF433 family)
VPSTVVSLRVSEEQAEQLKRKARQLGRTPSETGAMLLDEALRRDEFAFINFRDSPVGRQAHVLGSRLAVWQVVSIVGTFDGDIEGAAEHLAWPSLKVRAAMVYAAAYPEEIKNAIGDSEACDARVLARTLPQIEEFVAPTRSTRRKRK